MIILCAGDRHLFCSIKYDIIIHDCKQTRQIDSSTLLLFFLTSLIQIVYIVIPNVSLNIVLNS